MREGSGMLLSRWCPDGLKSWVLVGSGRDVLVGIFLRLGIEIRVLYSNLLRALFLPSDRRDQAICVKLMFWLMFNVGYLRNAQLALISNLTCQISRMLRQRCSP